MCVCVCVCVCADLPLVLRHILFPVDTRQGDNRVTYRMNNAHQGTSVKVERKMEKEEEMERSKMKRREE